MTPALELTNNDTLVISATQLEEIKTCPRRWRYRYLYRRIRATVNPAAAGGKAFDAALNHRYTKLGSAPCDPTTEQEMLTIVDAAYAGIELPFDEYRTAARYKEVVQAYNAYWGREPFEVLGVQVPFAVLLGEVATPPVHVVGDIRLPARVRVVMQGLLDLFVRMPDGHVMIVDTKTSKSGREGAYENSAQMKAYCWALPEIARQNPTVGLPERVHGCFINEVVIRPPYARADRKPGASDKARTEFRRGMPSFYSPERLEEWRLDTLLWVEQALGWVARDHFPQNEKSCPMHYGAKCGYLGICSLPVEQREMALASDEFMDYDRGPLAGMRTAEVAEEEGQ